MDAVAANAQVMAQAVKGVKERVSAVETQVGSIAGGVDVQGLLKVQEEQKLTTTTYATQGTGVGAAGDEEEKKADADAT